MIAISALVIAKAIFIAGLALWATILTINNITDPATNIKLVTMMQNMTLIKQDSNSGGQKLLWRAIDKPRAAKASFMIALILQLVSISILWWSVWLFVDAIFIGPYDSIAVNAAISKANFGLCCLMFEWFMFLCGGLWFVYWIKMGEVQLVHLLMLLITLTGFIFINLPVN